MSASDRNLYVVECWSNEMKEDLWMGGMHHMVDAVHFAPNLETARHWARTHLTWGGVDGRHEGWYPWHFKIRRVKINEDGCHIVQNTNEVVDIIYPTYETP